MISGARRLATAYAVVLCAVNIYFYNYASIYAILYQPRSKATTVRFNLYGDPQIEGDAKLQREPRTGKYDLLINDYYLRHIYKSTLNAFQPNYAVTMGDIFSSQWVNVNEYYKRIRRFKWITYQNDWHNASTAGKHLHYYLPGNHDIGYGSETRPYHVNRYLNNFGPLNRDWIIDFSVLSGHGNVSGSSLHRIAILNAMNLDKTKHEQYRRQTWEFVRYLMKERQRQPEIPLVLFLHIPLSKPAAGSYCVKDPVFSYQDGSVRYQDYLSPSATAYILHCLQPTVLLNGHDHKGCVAAHRIVDASSNDPLSSLQTANDLCNLTYEQFDSRQDEIESFAQQTILPISASALRETNGTEVPWSTIEITVRSSMGAYDGTTGIFDISPIRRNQTQQNSARVWSHRNVAAKAAASGYEYVYREVAFGYHIHIRVLAVVDLISLLLVPTILVLC